MSLFKIKLEDKAAFINRLEKANTSLSTNQIKDNKIEGYFEVEVDDSEQLNVIKHILKQSPKINTVKEMKTKLTKSKLKEIVKEELQNTMYSKSKINENVLTDPNFIAGISTLLGVGSAFAVAFLKDLKNAKTPEDKKKILQSAAAHINKTMTGGV